MGVTESMIDRDHKIKKLKWMVHVLLFSVVCLSFLVALFACAYQVDAVESSTVIVGRDQWVHVSVGDSHLESFGYAIFGTDLQLLFYAYNQSDLMLDTYVMVANTSVDDPLGKFTVFWGGAIGTSTVSFSVSSEYGQIAMIVQDFAGQQSWSRPKMTVRREVFTRKGEVFDVLVDSVHVASFVWDLVTVGDENQTVPQLTVYKNDGSPYLTKVLTNTYVSVAEYFDKVGWMVEAYSNSYVKWLLYSGFSLSVKLSSGFGGLDLPYFLVSARTTEPNQPVTVKFRLPEGISNYSASWTTASVSRFVSVVDELFNSATGEYSVILMFLDSAEGNRFTLEVSAEKYGSVYQSSDSIVVTAPAWKLLIAPVLVAVIIVGAMLLLVRRASEGRKTPPPASQAIRG